MLHEIWQAETRNSADKATDRFGATYEAKYPKAAGCMATDRETLLAFYDFPAAHWQHLRTTNLRRSLENLSTKFAQDALVGVKCKKMRF